MTKQTGPEPTDDDEALGELHDDGSGPADPDEAQPDDDAADDYESGEIGGESG